MDISGRFFEKKYKVCENAPKEVEWEKYYSEIMEEYKNYWKIIVILKKYFRSFLKRTHHLYREHWAWEADYLDIIHIWIH